MRVTPGSEPARMLSALRGAGLKAEELSADTGARAVVAATSARAGRGDEGLGILHRHRHGSLTQGEEGK